VTIDGSGLAGSEANEKQTITLTGAIGGTFKLYFGGYITGNIAWNASTADMQSALESLAPIGSGNVSVTGSPGAWVVEFIGALAYTDVAIIAGYDTSLLVGGMA
jgi:hypothetical protein